MSRIRLKSHFYLFFRFLAGWLPRQAVYPPFSANSILGSWFFSVRGQCNEPACCRGPADRGFRACVDDFPHRVISVTFAIRATPPLITHCLHPTNQSCRRHASGTSSKIICSSLSGLSFQGKASFIRVLIVSSNVSSMPARTAVGPSIHHLKTEPRIRMDISPEGDQNLRKV